MTEEKQIEELADIICEIDDNGYSYNEDGYEITGYANANKIASVLVYKGYRKQIRGEWKLGKSGCMYFCSSCEYAAHPREEEEWNFCPRCGTKMKGGAE